MAQIVFTIPDANLSRVIDALAAYYEWKVADGAKAAFVKAKVAGVLTALVKQAERENAISAAAAPADSSFTDPGIS
jgi:hypothetical protein